MLDNPQAKRRTNVRYLVEEALKIGTPIRTIMDFYGVSYKYCLEVKQSLGK